MIMTRKVIEIRNLSYSYPDGAEALKNINIEIFEGESLGIIGPNGAGKSTLLLHLNGILKADAYIKVLGLDLNDGNLSKIRSRVGLVFQDPDDQLFMPTVFDDVAFGPINLDLKKDEVKKRVEEALKAVGMLDLVDRIAHHLSFGEKKRIAIATALSMKPEILALDEPSSNLDPKARKELITILKSFNHTKIIAGHDLELILEICNRVVVLDGGKVAASGDTKEILDSAKFLI